MQFWCNSVVKKQDLVLFFFCARSRHFCMFCGFLLTQLVSVSICNGAKWVYFFACRKLLDHSMTTLRTQSIGSRVWCSWLHRVIQRLIHFCMHAWVICLREVGNTFMQGNSSVALSSSVFCNRRLSSDNAWLSSLWCFKWMSSVI